MNAYTRESFESVRAKERARLRELEAIGGELGAEAHVRQAYADGIDPAAFRAKCERDARKRAEVRAALEIAPLPDGERLTGARAVAVVLLNMGRRDLAGQHCEANKVDMPLIGSVRETFGRLVGARIGSGVALDELFMAALDDADRATFASSAAGMFPSSGLGSAVRDAASMVVRDAWMRSGSFWRRACRIVRVPNFREHRIWATRSGGVSVDSVTDTAVTPAVSSDVSADWPSADVAVAERRERIALSRKRLINGGFEEVGAFFAAATASWNDRLDELAAAALDSAVEWSGTAAEFVTGAPAAVNGQTIGGLTLGSDAPCVLLAGDGPRRSLALETGAVPAADGDRRAMADRAVYSAAVEAAGGSRAYLIHGGFAPLVLPVLRADDFEPVMAYGPGAGVRDADGHPVPYGAAIGIDFGDPVLLAVPGSGADRGRGAVRLTIT